jgi:hypothetical protein
MKEEDFGKNCWRGIGRDGVREERRESNILSLNPRERKTSEK